MVFTLSFKKKLIQEWGGAQEDYKRQVLIHNLWFDRRISSQSADEFEQLYQAELRGTSIGVRDALRSYARLHVWGPHRPSGNRNNLSRLIDQLHNAQNILSEKSTERIGELGHLMNLCGYETRVSLKWYRDNQMALPSHESADRLIESWPLGVNFVTSSIGELSEWLNEQRENLSDEVFLDAILHIVNTSRSEQGGHQGFIWAFSWDGFLSAISCDPKLCEADQWCAAVGVAVEPGQLWAILKYSVSEVQALIRPSQLEAGANEYHFPSPPCPDCQNCGRAMLLSADAPTSIPVQIQFPSTGEAMPQSPIPSPEFSKPPVAEFLHQTILHSKGDVFCLKASSFGTDKSQLGGWRAAHHSKLESVYPRDVVLGWMPSPHTLF